MNHRNHGLWSNCLFILKFAFKANNFVFYVKISQIIIRSVTPFIPILFIRIILNEITVNKNTKLTLAYVILFAASSFITDLINSILDFYSRNQTEIMIRKIKNSLGIAVMKMKYSDVEHPKIRDFIELAKDSTNFYQVLDLAGNIITSLLTISGLFIIITTVQPIIFLLIALVILLRLIADKKNRDLWDKWRPKYAPIMRKVGYYFRVMKSIDYGKEIRINNLQDWIHGKINNQTDEYFKASKQHNIELQKNGILSSAASIVQEGVVYIILAYKVVFQGMLIGDFSMYLISISTFSNSISSIVSAVSSILQLGLFVNDFRYCIELSNNQNTNENNNKRNINFDNVVLEFKNVSFKYPNTENYILKNISFKIDAKESVSIVGVNGAGKTTLIKLICRFYEPTNGEILLNGVNIKTIPYSEYINYIGAVFQDFKLFSFSVAENISFSEQQDDSRIFDCLYKCGLGEKIRKLPAGIKTNINKEFDSEGIEFSGGEGQKLALARTLYKNAPIIILDEPTSALDSMLPSLSPEERQAFW